MHLLITYACKTRDRVRGEAEGALDHPPPMEVMGSEKKTEKYS